MAAKILLVRADTRPRITVTFTDANSDPSSPTPINITGGTPTMKFRKAGSPAGTPALGTVNGVVSDGPNGGAYYDWPVGLLDQPAGDYEGELSVTFGDGTKQTAYEIQKFSIREHF